MKRIRRAYTRTVSLIDETAVQIYQSFVGKDKGFLLESYDRNNGRYVFMGREPEEIICTKKDQLLVIRSDGSRVVMKGNPAELLKIYYSDFEIRKDDEQLYFCGGLVGALGYDFVRYMEDLPDGNPDEIGIDTIQLMLVTEFLSIDHLSGTMTAVVIEEDNLEGRQRAEARCELMVQEAFARISDEGTPPMEADGKIVSQSDSLEDYFDRVDIGRADVPVEVVSTEEARFETIMLGLRLNEGVDENDFFRKHHISLDKYLGIKLREMEKNGLMVHEGNHWKMTERGFDIQNAVLVELMD